MPSGGGGGTNVTTNLPTFAKPYYQELLKQTGLNVFNTTQDVTDPKTGKVIKGGQVTGIKEYQPYAGGDVNARVAGFSPLQQQAQGEIGNLQTPEQFAAATQGANVGMNMGYGSAAQGLQQAFGYRPGQFNVQQVEAPELSQYQMGGPERVSSQMFSPGAASYYMSPFQQNVSDIAAREYQRTADINAAKLAQQGAAMGQSGGSRQALLEAEAMRNTNQGIGDIYARGQQAAYENAQKAFQQDQANRMQASLANQQAGLTTGIQNLQALLGVQSLGAGENLQAQLANQQYGLQGQQLSEQARQYAAGLGKDIGLSGLQQGLAGSQLMGQLGTAQQQADLARLQQQDKAGAEQQALEQQKKDIAYQQAMEARDYGKSQLQFYSDILRGNAGALGSQTVSYNRTNPYAQAAGLGIAGLGALSRS
jgi:hypothetical protein